MKKLILLLALIVCYNAFAQENYDEGLTTKIGVAARADLDSVVVRWAVSTSFAWKICKDKGFIVERAPINKNNTYGTFTPVKEGVFKQWSEEQWDKYLSSKAPRQDTTEIDYDAFAYMFGASSEDPDKIKSDVTFDIGQIKEKKSSLQFQVLFAILSANSSAVAAEALGLRYVDRNIKPGERYVYRVSAAGQSSPYTIQSGQVEVTVQKYSYDFARQILQASENEGSIGLSWKINKSLTLYKVERSSDKGKTFQKLTKAPLLTMKAKTDVVDSAEGYLDTLITNYKPYTYRIYGTTAFGETVLVGEITAMGRDRTPPEQPNVPQPKQIDDKHVKITWEMSSSPAKDLKGFYVGRDSSAMGEFKYITKLIPPDKREYIDSTFSTDYPNFYLVEAIDTAGNISQSYPIYVALNDTTPPAIPKWISGIMDSVGVVHLKVTPNKEKDLMGYRILRSNSAEHEFSSLIESFGEDTIDYTKITEFTDTVSLETLTPNIYYRITALDNRYNESDFSDILVVKRPDIIPPVAPIITEAEVNETMVTLLFIPSSSNDVRYHTIYRRLSGEAKWDSIGSAKNNDSTFTDNNVKQNVIYDYCMTATDSTGWKSKLSQPMSARPYFTGVIPEVTSIEVTLNDSNLVQLKWDYTLKPGIYFEIYRSFENKAPVSLALVKGPELKSYTDQNLSYGKGNYSYTIKAFDKIGGESKISKAVVINVK